MTMEKITVGRIVAKLRNTVPVCLIENGTEVKRYKNIEFPDELKTLEAAAFGFNIGLDDKITFNLCFDEGILPINFPANRKSISRAEQVTAKASTFDVDNYTAEELKEIDAIIDSGVIPETVYTKVQFNITGDRRKMLVMEVAEITGCKPEYTAAPDFTYTIGNHRVDRFGTLTGKIPLAMVNVLEDRGFIVEVASMA